MQWKTDVTDSGYLHRQAEQLTAKLLRLAARRFGAEPPMPWIRFDLRGKSAGQFRALDKGRCLIRYNAQLLERHPREFLSQTVPHETAHLVAFSLFGPRIAPHGGEWRTIMATFGAPPERCHSYSLAGVQTRRLRRYQYRCACRTHQLTSIRHNRVRSGQSYLCRQCGKPLERVPEPAADSASPQGK